MKKLLSLPPNLVGSFHEIANADPADWFCTSDPVGARLGSGGGTTWLLEACRRDDNTAGTLLPGEWLAREKRILRMPEGESALAWICTFGQDIDTDPGVQVGEGTEIISKPSFTSTPVVRGNHAQSTGFAAYADCQWRCLPA